MPGYEAGVVVGGLSQASVTTQLEALNNGDGWFGDGSDGTKTVVGTETLTRDMYWTDLTVPNGTTLNTGGCRIFVSGTLTIATGGKIHRNGLSVGDSPSGGASTGGGTIAAPTNAGPNAGVGAGSNGTAARMGGAGGSGGAGTSGAGGAGGTIAGPQLGPLPRSLPFAILGREYASGSTISSISCGASGGTGAGDGINGGGGPGSGGGQVIIAARTVVLNGTIESIGGNGGTRTVGNVGGGGGGGGGWITLVRRSRSGSGSMLVTGGSPGAGVGTGVTGVAGSVGVISELAA